MIKYFLKASYMYALIFIPMQEDTRGCLRQKDTAGSKHKSSIGQERVERES